ncbi:MAG: hypothetical protein NUV98_06690 [Candidatus Roizmanbacteria bacterium]|nr:hypothetical protein [Candidatus Roizmanbacteria bacterium]
MDNQPQPPVTPPAPTAPTSAQPAPASQPTVPAQSGMSHDTKTIIVILLLILVYPIGLIMMYIWMKWPMWAKILITLPILLLFILPILAATVLVAINPKEQLAKARDTERIAEATSIQQQIRMYQTENNGEFPASLDTLVPDYLPEVPTDPSTSQLYTYSLDPGGQDFALCVEFESEQNATLPNCVDSTNSF